MRQPAIPESKIRLIRKTENTFHSPGCFSLFRASAVMDTNVMHTYKSVAKTPKHHVQYDQGEDRWLCTLMLKQGWRVEYSAASDSFTACPEVNQQSR